MTNTHQFKVGDRAIVLPVNHYYPFQTVEVVYDLGDDAVYPLIVRTIDLANYPMHPSELHPLPIPYSQLDQE